MLAIIGEIFLGEKSSVLIGKFENPLITYNLKWLKVYGHWKLSLTSKICIM